MSIVHPERIIHRHESNEYRDIQSTTKQDEHTLIVSSIAGQPETRKRIWKILDYKIIECKFMDQKDEKKNRPKILKLIKNWNLGHLS